ncbi:MAG TPA: TIGR03936 family radical SAM-associated protein [Gemmataceae bacterium]|nr:TIGR03936 family radical SAM-associated protein [Gemmataceae bacterium]
MDKARIRFRKDGALRLLSHHDLMRTFERLLRRSELPFHRSQGFHPKPRLIFALSLPLGVVGCEEVAELELAEILSLDEIHARLTRHAPPGLEILSVRRIPVRVNAQVYRLTYALPVPAERLPDLSRRIADVLSASECWIDRHRPHSGQADRRLDVRPFLVDLLVQPPRGTSESAMLEMVLRLTTTGTARPHEVLGLLGLEDLLDAGAVLERSRLELHDEYADGLAGEPASLATTQKGSHEKRDAD